MLSFMQFPSVSLVTERKSAWAMPEAVKHQEIPARSLPYISASMAFVFREIVV
jgi:hypothetical protein